MLTRTLHFFLAILIGFSSFVQAQKPRQIKLIHADNLRYDEKLGKNIQRLIGNVKLLHDSTYLYCDSAYLDESNNSFTGFNDVHIDVNDTLDIFSRLLYYDGNTRVAELHDSVKLIDKRATLTTDVLIYDRKTRVARYFTGGKIVDEHNVLTSIKGYYYTNNNEAFFKDSVVLTNPDYVMNSDTLRYNTETEIAHFTGPTTITSEENLIYCENGWYNTKTDVSQFDENAYIQTPEQLIKGDSMYYDRTIDFGKAYDNVSITDTVHDFIISGHYGEFWKANGYSFVTDSTEAILIDRLDSLFLHADTLWVDFDSTQKAKRMHAYHQAKFFRYDLQGMTDSLIYDFVDSAIRMYKEPVLWSEENQLTSDSVHILITDNEIDSMVLYNTAFIISRDDTGTFNQIKGRQMTGYFMENDLRKVKVKGNSQTIYFVREEDGNLIGIQKILSSDMLIYLRENEIKTITYISQPKGSLFPERELTREELFIKGFNWYGDRRPLSRKDIYIW